MSDSLGWIGLGRMAAAKAHGVAMPAAAAMRESVACMVGRGHEAQTASASATAFPYGPLPC